MKRHGCRAALLTVVFAASASISAADQGFILYCGWDYNLKKQSWDIFKVPASGGTATGVVVQPADQVYPFIFPKEKAFGYLVEKSGTEVREIFKYDLDSRAVVPLGLSVRANTTCQVSPDGRQLACADAVGTYNQIVVFDLASKERQQITALKNDCLDPSWSPDGKRLVYWTGGGQDIIAGESKPKGNHLAIYNFESKVHNLLTKVPGNYDAYPRWSPDGKWVAFHRKTSGGDWHIWLIRPDGTEQTQLTIGKGEKSHPTWSPDSKQIAFQLYRSDPDAYDICTVSIETKDIMQVTNTDKIDEQQPIWLP